MDSLDDSTLLTNWCVSWWGPRGWGGPKTRTSRSPKAGSPKAHFWEGHVLESRPQFHKTTPSVISARGQDSSVGGVPVGYCPDDGHMEEEVQLKVQVEEEEEIGETHGKEQGEEQRVKERTTLMRMTRMTMQMRRRAPTHS